MHDPDHQRHHHHDDAAVDDAARGAAADPPGGEHLLEGVIHDGHGEVQLDPDGADRAVAKHRRDADQVESPGEQAADETRGAITPDGA